MPPPSCFTGCLSHAFTFFSFSFPLSLTRPLAWSLSYSTFGVSAHMVRYSEATTRWDSWANGFGQSRAGLDKCKEAWQMRAVLNCDLLHATSQTSTLCAPCRADDKLYACGAEDVCFNGLYSFTLSEHVECDDSLSFARCAMGSEEGGRSVDEHEESDVRRGDEFFFCAEEEEICVCSGTMRYYS